MIPDFAPRLARVLTEYCRPVQEGDKVAIMTSTAAEPLVEALVEAVLRQGGHPLLWLSLPNMSELVLKHASDAQLQFINPLIMTLITEADVLYSIRAPANTKNLASIDPQRLTLSQQGQRPVNELYQKRAADDSIRWNITAWPTQAAAQDANMGFLDFERFVYEACGLHYDDPVAYWLDLRDRQDRLVAWLSDKSHAEVRGPGIDLTFDFGGRKWKNSFGIRNFPDGEIFTSPIEESVNGHVEFNHPTVYVGRELSGITLTFKDGVVVDAHAAKDEPTLLNQLDLDEGARRLGEFAIGTNMSITRFTREILFDEKMGGTVHMALGLGFPELGGVNKSVVHWDMVHGMLDGGEIWIDGQLFYRAGQFMV